MATILVLDDVDDAVRLTQRILRLMGHDVFGFTEEDEAIECTKTQSIDLVILDLRLKRMSGIDVFKTMRRFAPMLRGIILTGFPTAETTRECRELGISAYCIKPIGIEELEARVTAALSAPLSS